jgi:hypothetical protein
VVPVFSTHIVGGDVTYRCLGNDRYEISLTVRRDCINGNPGAQFDDPAHLGIFDGNGMLLWELGAGGVLQMPFRPDDTLNEIVTTRCGLIGGDICVHTTTYVDTLTLPFREEGYILAYQRCCRNFTISNIVDPLTVGSTFTVRIRSGSLKLCNSSPLLNAWPPVYVCGDAPLDFNLKATDEEGDSLVYEICNPLTGADQMDPRPTTPSNPPYAPVAFKAPYSLADVIGGQPRLNIGLHDGRMRGYVQPPITQYLVAYCVREYRNGILLSELQREFQINVRTCISNAIADFDYTLDRCSDPVTIQFKNKSSAPNSSLRLTHWVFQWNGITRTSADLDPSVVLSDSGVLRVRLFAESREGCRDTAEQLIRFSPIVADLIADTARICRGDSVRLLKSFDPNLSYKWSPTDGLSCSDCAEAMSGIGKDILYYLTISDGQCDKKDSVRVLVNPCQLDTCAVNVRQKCLPGGTVELTVENALGQFVRPKARDHELFWYIKPVGGQAPYSIRDRNPVIMPSGSEFSLTSKRYSWAKGLPKSIEYADICQRRLQLVADTLCSGPCDEMEFILSSCEDNYDLSSGLDFPPSLCQSICWNECEYIIALFEKNGKLIDPASYEIRWSNGSKGSHVLLMGPYYDNLTVEVRRGDCIWYGRYIRSCPLKPKNGSLQSIISPVFQNREDKLSEGIAWSASSGFSSAQSAIGQSSLTDIWIAPTIFQDETYLYPGLASTGQELNLEIFHSSGLKTGGMKGRITGPEPLKLDTEWWPLQGVYFGFVRIGEKISVFKLVKF